VRNRESWELEAENWVRWARTPAHDAYWYYRHAFFDAVVPPPGRLTVEVGCGEGRVTRDLRARRHRVVSVDGSPTLLRYAVASDPGGRYVRSDAGALPLGDASADLVVSYNSLMDFDDMPGAVSEVARVLLPGAPFCMCVTHPILDAGSFDTDAEDSPYRLRDRYLGTKPFEEVVERDGLTMRFKGWSHALEEYFDALAAAGLVVDRLREPVPSAGSRDKRWHRYPMFLMLRAVKR
jgi:SAM-dependent methyltransferase